VTPFIFLSVTFFMMYYLVISRPMQSLAGFLIMLAGLVIYAISYVRIEQSEAQKVTITK